MTELYINNNNINDFYNCNYLSITSLIIEASQNINLLLDKLYKFTNIKELKLRNNKITEIKGLDNLVNLQVLNLSNNQITELKGLQNLVCLQKLHLSNNQITEIKGLHNLTDLKELRLDNNHIKEIKGLDNLVNLRKLILSINKITEIKGLNTLTCLQELQLNYNQITEIKGLHNLVKLQVLNLENNLITEIKGLDKLINLQILDLNDNKIIEIKEINYLVNLQILDLHNNEIIKINELNNLINLKELYLSNNKITEISKLDNLRHLQELDLDYNQIKELPLILCNLRNVNYIFYSNNPIEYIPLPVQRLLNRINNRVTKNNMVYNDKQNIHNHHIQNSFRTSLSNIFKDKQLLDLQTIKQQILENNVLLEQTKREILNYCDDDTMHTSYLITYSDLLIYVWSRIIASVNADEILTVLNQEINDGICMCFTGRLTRLLNTLVGFYDDIELQISDSEQITNIIMSLKDKFADKELSDAVRKELQDRQYSETIINEWLDYI
jgi:Leucine-rich repeat (LRR) protein